MDIEQLRQPIDAESLRVRVLGGQSGWRCLDVVAETESTNADLTARAANGEEIDGAILIAEHQTAGRGRNGRAWVTAPFTQIVMSVGVAVEKVQTRAWGWLPLLAGVAVADVVNRIGLSENVGLKWPNDVLAGDRKLAGILVEVSAPNRVVIGVGLNVTMDVTGFGALATSLFELGAEAPDRGWLLRHLLIELGARLDGWRSAGGADACLVDHYRAMSLTIGAKVRALLPGHREIVGVALDIDSDGRLLIAVDGASVAIAAGDIVHLRPAGT